MDLLDANLEVLRRAVERRVAKVSRAAEQVEDAQNAVDPAADWSRAGWLARLFGGRS